MTKKKPKEVLLTEDNFLIETGLSRKALRQCEKNGFIKAEKRSDSVNYYSQKCADHGKAMMMCLGRCANLAEAHEMALQGMSEKERRDELLAISSEGDSERSGLVDPRKINKHPRFEALLRVVEDVLEKITVDMAVNGYDPLQPVLMGIWPELEKPVLIDGHTRVRAAIDTAIPVIPYVIREFDDEMAALLHTAKLQTQRRQTDPGVQFRLFESLDRLIRRGGDRRSEQVKSKPPNGGIEKKRSLSAQRTADLVGWTVRMVERARRVRDQATPEILEDARNGKMSVSKAEKTIDETAKTKTKTASKSPAENQNAIVQLTAENFAALNELGGTRHEHVNEAVRQYIARRGWEHPVKQEETESDDQKPRLVQ